MGLISPHTFILNKSNDSVPYFSVGTQLLPWRILHDAYYCVEASVRLLNSRRLIHLLLKADVAQ